MIGQCSIPPAHHEGISYWLRGNIIKGYKKPSWSVLVEALRGMGENAVADDIEKEKKI